MREAAKAVRAQQPESSLIDVRGLTVRYGGRRDAAVTDVSFTIARGEIFGLVGESGSGKSTVGRQLLGERGAWLASTGEVFFDRQNILKVSNRELQAFRGIRISFVPQNPTTALNPSIRVGEQIAEIIRIHRTETGSGNIAERVRQLMHAVSLPEVEVTARRYPSQLSGGQQQRIAIAMAIACSPDIIVLDEPTTGLDVTTQRQIVDLLAELRTTMNMSMLYITHDLLLLRELADRIGVMYAGRLLEVADTEAIFEAPAHPYTQGLSASVPGQTHLRFPKLAGILDRNKISPDGCPFAPRCNFSEERCKHEGTILFPVACDEAHQVACWKFDQILPQPNRPLPAATVAIRDMVSQDNALCLENIQVEYGAGLSAFTAVHNVGLEVQQSEILALIGESGSGKSSLARAICGIAPIRSGSIRLGAEDLAFSIDHRTSDQTRKVQFIFQNPDASLNSRMSIRGILRRPLDCFFKLSRDEEMKRIYTVLDQVGLDASYVGRWPGELSGGERQRVAIARALLAEPQFLICDEILSALDVSVQARILDLLNELRHTHKVGILFISHDLSVVSALADRIAVMYRGSIVATGLRSKILDRPEHPYVKQLLAAAPKPPPSTIYL